MAEAYATVEEYQDDVRVTLDDAGVKQVASKLAGASALIRSVCAREGVPVGDADPDILRMVCIQAAQRAITNPGGRRYRQVGSTSEGYDEQSGLYLTDAEEQQLLDSATNGNDDGSGVYTVGLRDEAYPPCPYGLPSRYNLAGW